MTESSSRRKPRQEQFMALDAGTVVDLSPALIGASLRLLTAALEDRLIGARTKNNHYAPNAPGCIVLIVCGFDSWLNELIEGGSHRNRGPQHNEELRKLAFAAPTLVKYAKAPERATGKTLKVGEHVDILLSLRDELVHHLPRYPFQGAGPPRWLFRLEEMGLLLTESDGRPVPLLVHKLCSYALAYWAWEAVNSAAEAFVKAMHTALPPPQHCFLMNFRRYKKEQQLRHPQELWLFDFEHGMSSP